MVAAHFRRRGDDPRSELGFAQVYNGMKINDSDSTCKRFVFGFRVQLAKALQKLNDHPFLTRLFLCGFLMLFYQQGFIGIIHPGKCIDTVLQLFSADIKHGFIHPDLVIVHPDDFFFRN